MTLLQRNFVTAKPINFYYLVCKLDRVQYRLKGGGGDETKLAEHRSPNRDDLDAVSTTQPIFIYRSDCHSSVGNSKALELSGIDENTPDPVGGKIERFADGRPTGFMREVAAS